MPTLYVIEAYSSRAPAGWRRSAFIFKSKVEAELFAIGQFKAIRTRVVPLNMEDSCSS